MKDTQFARYVNQYIQKEDNKTMGLSWETTPSAKRFKREGIREGKLETAKNMLKKGLSIDLIVEVTDLPKESIEELENESNQSN